MPDYRAPVSTTHHVLNNVLGLSQLAERPLFAEATDELVEAVIAEAARFAEAELAPLNEVGDQQGVSLNDRAVTTAVGFKDAYTSYAQGGWLGLAVPAEYSGQGLPFTLHMAVSEYWNSANLSLALCPMLSMGAIEALITHADDALRDRFLEPLVSGSWTGTMNLTEPHAGSDLATVRTQAVPDGEAFRITGQKIYISWGDHDLTENILHLVLARLPGAPEGTRGLSLFLVPKWLPNESGDLVERNLAWPISCEHKVGIHASPTCVMQFGDEQGTGALGYLVGEPNNGLACMFTMMNHARLEVGLEGVGLAERAYQAAQKYALDRRQGRAPGREGGAPIVAHADVRRMLLLMRSLTEAGRMLAFEAAIALDISHATDDAEEKSAAQARLELLTPIVKAWCTEMAQEVTSLAIQVHGGMGYVEETGVAQYWRDARITPIYEGTNGIQSLDLIGRKFLRDGGAEFSRLVSDIRATERALASHNADDLSALAPNLAEIADRLEQSGGCILNAEQDSPGIAGGLAFDFMMLLGTALGAWLHARSLLGAAEVELAADEAARIRLSARFYLTQVTPRVGAYAANIRHHDTRILAGDDAHF